MPAQSPVRGRMALIAASLAGLLLLFVLGTVFSSGPVIEAGGTVPAARVEISEYMTSNGSAYPDGNGLFSDWVELHNTCLLYTSGSNPFQFLRSVRNASHQLPPRRDHLHTIGQSRGYHGVP